MSTTLDTIPVLDLEPDFALPAQIRGTRIQDMADLSPARRIAYYRGKQVIHTLYHEWTLVDRADQEELESFFHDRKGKWDGFFTPSWHGELEPKNSVASAGTSLQITGVDYLATLGALDGTTTLGNYIFMLHRDGTLHLDKVTAVSGTTTETLTLRDGVPQDFDLGDYIVGFLYYVRFLNDEMDLNFDGFEHARCNLSMQELATVDVEDDASESSIEDRVSFLDVEYYFTEHEDGPAVLPGDFSGGLLTISYPPGFAMDDCNDYVTGALAAANGGGGWGSQGTFYVAL
jgi:hypothetical protein